MINVTDLSQHGYLPDAAPATLPQNAFSYSRNWRFNQAGFAEVTPGYTDAYGGLFNGGYQLGGPSTTATFLSTWTLENDPVFIYYDSTAGLLTQGAIVNDLIVETALSTTPHTTGVDHLWQSTEAFGVPIFNNTIEAPWVYNSATPDVVQLTNWPANATCKQLTSTSAFLIAVGYSKSDAAVGEQGGSRSIAISDAIVTPGTLPHWDFSNADSFAQIIDLSLDTDGDLLSAYEQNGVVYINTTTNVIALTYQGDGIWAQAALPFPNGVLSSRASAVIPNGFFNIGNRTMYVHDGTTATTIGEGKFSETWFDSVNESRINEVQCIYDPRSKSVWIKTPITSDTQEIWIYNLENNTMQVLDDHQEIAYLFFSAEGIPTIPFTWDSFNENSTWEDIEADSWNEFPEIVGGALYRNRLMSVGPRNIFVHDQGTSFNGREITAVLQREDMRPFTGSYSTFKINRLIPWVSTTQSGTMLTCRVGGSFTTNGAVVWQPTRTLVIDTQTKLDFRTTVKWGAVEFVSSTSGHRLSGYELDVSPQGRR